MHNVLYASEILEYCAKLGTLYPLSKGSAELHTVHGVVRITFKFNLMFYSSLFYANAMIIYC